MSGPTNNRPTAGATVVPENFRTITRSSYQPCDAVRCPGRRNRDELRLWITDASGCVPRYIWCYILIYAPVANRTRPREPGPVTHRGLRMVFGFIGAFRCLKLPGPRSATAHARTASMTRTHSDRRPRDASPNRRPPYPTCTWHATEPQLDVRAHPDHYPTMSNLLARARPQGEWTHGEWTHGKCGWFARSTENSIKRGPTSHRGCV